MQDDKPIPVFLPDAENNGSNVLMRRFLVFFCAPDPWNRLIHYRMECDYQFGINEPPTLTQETLKDIQQSAIEHIQQRGGYSGFLQAIDITGITEIRYEG